MTFLFLSQCISFLVSLNFLPVLLRRGTKELKKCGGAELPTNMKPPQSTESHSALCKQHCLSHAVVEYAAAGQLCAGVLQSTELRQKGRAEVTSHTAGKASALPTPTHLISRKRSGLLEKVYVQIFTDTHT